MNAMQEIEGIYAPSPWLAQELKHLCTPTWFHGNLLWYRRRLHVLGICQSIKHDSLVWHYNANHEFLLYSRASIATQASCVLTQNRFKCASR